MDLSRNKLEAERVKCYSFVYSANTYVLSISHVLATVLGTENIGMTKQKKIPAFIEFTFGCGKTANKYINK